MSALSRRLLAEGVGSAFLLATVVGSGVMGAKLSNGNIALALLANSLATAAILFVLIELFAPISGAHFNPAVSLAMAMRRKAGWSEAGVYAAAQLVGAVLGVFAAHLMFDLPLLQASATDRGGAAQWFSEFVATFGLLLTIFGAAKQRTAPAVALYIGAAYWFTASTSFANPAVTLARALTDTFAGIAPSSAPAFVLAQLGGAVAAVSIEPLFWRTNETAEPNYDSAPSGAAQ